MSDKKHIDRLFQEKFKDFDVAPNDTVWERIEAQLHPEKKKRRVLIWWPLGGVAAALFLLLIFNKSIFTSNDTIDTIVDTEQPTLINEDGTKIDSPPKSNNTTISDTVASEDYDANSDSENNSSAKNTSSKAKQLNNNSVNYKASQESVVFTKINTEVDKRSNKTESNSDDTLKTSVATNEKHQKDLDNNVLKSKAEIDKLLKETQNADAVVSNSTVKDTSTNFSEKSDENTTIETIVEDKDIQTNEQTIEEAIAENEDILNEKEKEKLRRWSIAPNVAPVYFSSLGNGSSIDEQFVNNNTSGSVSISYGVEGGYAINKSLRLRTGVHRVSLNNITNDVIAQSDATLSASSTVATITHAENVTLSNPVSTNSLTLLSRTTLNNSTTPETINTLSTGNLEQRFGFIEVPLELEYRVIDKKLGVNVIGGFSTLFLNENEIYADVNGVPTLIGEANNLNNTSFSANFGIGVNYSLTEKLNINLEPKFKYQLNTFNNTSGNFQPFFIGVYTGLSFKF